MDPEPANRHNVITSILETLSTLVVPPPSARSTKKSLLAQLSTADTAKAKSLLLTLHFLYPHELLPALDLLDRRLVTRLTVSPNPSDDAASASSATFYVQSASAVTSKSSRSAKFRKTFNPADTYYEVRLDSWNCSCPAFAYSAFGGAHLRDSFEPEILEGDSYGTGSETRTKDEQWTFGGSLTSVRFATPICKHILAAVIGNVAPKLFEDGIEMRTASSAEIAGWAAGWGE